jgi:hypothetical protein
MWADEISMMLALTEDEQAESDVVAEGQLGYHYLWDYKLNMISAVLQNMLSELTSLVPLMLTKIISILTKRACDAILPVRSIPAHFRATSSKRAPSEPSYFVLSILLPVKAFFGLVDGEGPGSSLKDDWLISFSGDVFEKACQR